jgi:hypothetical protein
MILSRGTNIQGRKQNKKNIQGNPTPDYGICTRNKGRNIKKQAKVGSTDIETKECKLNYHS